MTRTLPALLSVVLLLGAAAAAGAQTGPDTWDRPAAPAGHPRPGYKVYTALKNATTYYLLCDGSPGGFFECNMTTGAWTTLPALPATMFEGGAATVVEGKVWYLPNKSLYVFDPASGAWSGAVAELPYALSWALAPIGQRLYAMTNTGSEVLARYRRFYSLDTRNPAAGWTREADTPFTPGMLGYRATALGDAFYAAPSESVEMNDDGDMMLRLWKYSGGAWTMGTSSIPGGMGIGSAMTTDGTRVIVMTGQTWGVYDGPELRVSTVRAYDGTSWSLLGRTPGCAQLNGLLSTAGLAYDAAAKRLHILRGGYTVDRYILDLASSPARFLSTEQPPVAVQPFFSKMGATSATPMPVSRGGGMIGGGGQLFAIQGIGMPTAARFDPKASAWSNLPDLPVAISARYTGDGGAVAFDGSKYLYVVGSASTFHRLDTTAPAAAWTAMTPLPAGVPTHEGACLVHVPADAENGLTETIVLIPGQTAALWKYSVATETWTRGADAPASFAASASAVHAKGGSFLYALQGSSVFWAYHLPSNRWNPVAEFPDGGDPADLPNDVLAGLGTSLCHPDSGRTIYALIGAGGNGNTTASLWTFQIPSSGEGAGRWTRKADPAYTISSGAALAYPGSGPHLYALAGNSSAVLMRYELPNERPTMTAPGQRTFGGSEIPARGSSFDGGWIVEATLDDADLERVTLEVEFRALGDASYATLRSAPVPSGGRASVTIPVPAEGNYEWRARAVDIRDGGTAWSEFGGSAGVRDVCVRAVNGLPSARPSLTDGETGATIPEGGQLPYGHFSLRVGAIIDDPDAFDDQARLDVEIRSLADGRIFAASGAMVPSGGTSAVTIEIRDQGDYTLRTRYTDEFGFQTAWTPFGSGEVGFQIPNNGSTGPAICGQSAGIALVLPVLLGMIVLIAAPGHRVLSSKFQVQRDATATPGMAEEPRTRNWKLL